MENELSRLVERMLMKLVDIQSQQTLEKELIRRLESKMKTLIKSLGNVSTDYKTDFTLIDPLRNEIELLKHSLEHRSKEGMISFILKRLKHYSITRIAITDNILNRKYHKVVVEEATSDPMQNNKICKVIKEGFYEFHRAKSVLRPAEVSIYKYLEGSDGY